jgi:hypothetical protein
MFDEKHMEIGVSNMLANIQSDFTHYCPSYKDPIYIYAHNSGLFDIHLVIKYLLKFHTQSSKRVASPQIIADNNNDIFQLSTDYLGRR